MNSSLTRLIIGNGVTSIGQNAFLGLIALTNISVESNNQQYDSRDNCNAIIETASNTLIFGCQSTVIPNTITTIDHDAFYSCTSLTSINISNSVMNIGDCAFAGCSGLTSITIPNSVTAIGFGAFSNCNALSDVYSFITDLSEGMYGVPFYSYPANYSDRTLHVPYGTSAAYQADSNWGPYFGTIVEMDPVPATSIELDKTSAVILEGETLQLTATVLPGYTTYKVVGWYSSNPAVATVDENGLVTAVSVGTATITAVTTDGSNLSASCNVTVLQEIVLAESIQLNVTTAGLNEGSSLLLTATVLPFSQKHDCQPHRYDL